MAKSTSRNRTFRINNMTGLMNTMAEENAFLTLDPNARMGAGGITVPFEFKDVTNWMPLNRGGMSITFGYTLLKYVGSATKITGLYRYIKSGGTSYFMVSYGSTLYTLSSGTLTSTTMSVTSGAYLDFETAYDKLIVCDGAGNVQTWDGTTVANLATGGDATAVNGGRQSLFYANRLFIFSSTHDTSLLYYSDGGNIATGYASNFINCDVNDGQQITSISKFFIPGNLEPIIIVSKTRSVGVVTGDGTTANPFTFSKISNDLGVPGFRQINQYQQDATFLTPRGVSSYRTALQNNNIEQALISSKITNQFTSLPADKLPDALSWFDWKNRRITYAVTTGTNDYPDTLWHYDIELRGWYRQQGFITTAAMVDTDGYVYTGTDDGKILKHDPEVFSYDGAIISSRLETPYLDFYEPDHYKRIIQGKVVCRGNGQYDLGMSTKINYGLSTASSHNIPITTGAFTWGGGTWTSDPSVYQWGNAPINRHKLYPGGIFENISFTFVNAAADQPVDLLEMTLEVEYLNLI